MKNSRIRYLALGDSYSIGEQVPARQRFPNQLVAQLKAAGHLAASPRIIAQTGWTTDELASAIKKCRLRPPFDVVSLLIGVNNQYRGRSVSDYAHEFEALLQTALVLSGNRPERVVVLSIPDWGVTPFAEGRNRQSIAHEINLFNQANKAISERKGVHYIDITPWSREAALHPELITGDGLHPSGIEYKRWAAAILTWMQQELLAH